ncbi:copper homeostasis protein CutC [Chitinophaga deserti]|uniref:copper homeostasis protein CutC n=1 Tax=Chitinophaga deserti TaxID=2164099 RepID=UPI000D6C450D|nr:copper homeostasis protein CutC [Chitinophaga deserti]
MKNITLEICATSVASCIAAQEGGADRIELCDNLLEGGTTPSHAMIAAVREQCSLKIYPIIRPRGGDFLYDDTEFAIMKKDIEVCKQLGCDGVVIGLLTADGKVDLPRTRELVEAAKPMGVTFHRAFDMTDDAFQALEDIIASGCERILTSGQRNTAMEGASLIRELVEKAAGRIRIMAGSGLRAHNAEALAKASGATEYHSTARDFIDSRMQYRNPNVSMGGIPGVPEYGISVTQATIVSAIRQGAEKGLNS